MAENKTETGNELEWWVAAAYRQMGARKVEHNVELVGNQIDVYVELETPGRLLHLIAVEAKNWTSPVGIDVVNRFAQKVKLLRDERLVHEGIIVSPAGFSRQARSAAKNYNIRLLEPADLYAMIEEKGRFTPWLDIRWTTWERDIRKALRQEGVVDGRTTPNIPPPLRRQALRRYFDLSGNKESLVLNVDSLSLTTADRTQAWLAAWDPLVTKLSERGSLDHPTQFAPLVDPLAEALGLRPHLTGSLGGLHAVVVSAPVLRLQIPPQFPLVFVEPTTLRPGVGDALVDMIQVLDLGEFFGVLIPFETPEGADANAQQLKHLLRASPYAHDFIVLSHEDVLTLLSAREPAACLVERILDQVDLTVVSPFVTSGPVPDRMFFGRDQEIKTIVQALPRSDFAVIGNRKIGKTSLLRRIERILEGSQEYVPIPLNFQAVRDNDTLFEMLAQEVGFAAANAAPNAFSDLIAHVHEQYPDRMPVLLIDEVDGLLDFDTAQGYALSKVWRTLAFEGACRFVFVGSRVLARALRDANSPFFNFPQEIRLGFLQADKARAVVSGPMDEMGIQLEPRAALLDRILDLSSCHPNLVQFICARLIERISAHGERRIVGADLNGVAASGDFADYYLDTIWGQAQPLERAITILSDPTGFTMPDMEATLVRRGFNVAHHEVQEALDMLSAYSLLARKGRKYVLTPISFSRLLRMSHEAEYLLVEAHRAQVRVTEQLYFPIQRERGHVFWHRGSLPSDSPMFVGREGELAHIQRLCRGEVESYILILGAQQSGKSSLLYQLGTCLGTQAQVVPINLRELSATSPAEMFHYIAQELATELTTELYKEDRSPDNVDSAPTLKQLLCDLSPARTTVVTIDEIGAVQPQAARDLANALRAFHQDRLRSRYRVLRRYVFVLAGGIELYDLATSDVSTLINISDKLYLSDLSRAESDTLLNRGFAELGIEEPVARLLSNRIFDYACGHPYLTQRLGGLVEETLELQGRVPTVDELGKMALHLTSDDANIVSLINDLRKEWLWTTAQLIARGQRLPFSRLASVTNRLELLGLIRNEDGYCVVRNPIYQEAIRYVEEQERQERPSGLSLQDILPGIADAKAYEQSVFEMLYSFFAKQLSHPERESRTADGTERRDILFLNTSPHEFWQMVARQHAATHIVFECKNTETLKPEHVNQLVEYLGRPLGNFGVIVSRLPPDENLQRKAITAFNRNDKVVLFLSDKDLAEMAQLHEQGGDPTAVIEHKYVQLTRAMQ